MRPLVTIPEYKSVTIDGLNEAKDIPYLKRECFKYNTTAPEKSPYKIQELRNNQIEIANTSYAGIIQLENTRIHFSTKVKANLFYMLSFLRDEKHFHYDPEIIIDIKEGENFFDILGRLFLNELDKISKFGFFRDYVRKEENVSFLRGKLLAKKQLRNDISKCPKFYCSYEDLTYDNLENRIVLRATTLLIPLIKYNDIIRSELMRYSSLLRDEVSLVNVVPEYCNKVQYSRLNEYYESIIQFSKVILQNYFIRTTHEGMAKGFNFIVNMNKVYEDFITQLIEETVSGCSEFFGYIVDKQKKFDSLVEEKKVFTRPDVILRKRDTDEDPVIIDAKYKIQENNADYYQVIAYALAIPTVRTCCLLYPETESVQDSILTIPAERFGHRRPDIKLCATTLKLYTDDDLRFNDYIKSIKTQIKEKLRVYL